MVFANIIRSVGSLREGSRSAGGRKVLFCKLISGLGFIFGAGLGWFALFSSWSAKMRYWHPELVGAGDVAVFDSHWWGLIFIVGMGFLFGTLAESAIWRLLILKRATSLNLWPWGKYWGWIVSLFVTCFAGVAWFSSYTCITNDAIYSRNSPFGEEVLNPEEATGARFLEYRRGRRSLGFLISFPHNRSVLLRDWTIGSGGTPLKEAHPVVKRLCSRLKSKGVLMKPAGRVLQNKSFNALTEGG